MSSSLARLSIIIVTTFLEISVLAAPGVLLAATHQINNSQSRPVTQPLGIRALHRFYSIIRLGDLGGTQSSANGINNRGWVTGFSNLPGDLTDRPTLWTDGRTIDLGILGGNNSSVDWPVKDDRGDIPGNSSTSATDPLGEDFCFNNAPYLCQGFLWRNGVMIPLPTLGGYNSSAAGENNRGQIVGWAENSTVDPTCVAPQILDWEAVIWRPELRQMQQLPTFAGDAVAGAVAINDLGQVVGTSGACVGPAALAHAVLWQKGAVINLGSLGGKLNNIATAINNRGQIVGFSDLTGDTTQHAFLWQQGLMTDLGTLPGDSSSSAFGINNHGQSVGISCDASGNCRAVLWQDGVITDLNSLVPPHSRLFLTYGGDINDRGEIAGGAFDMVTGSSPAFVAVPYESNAMPAASNRRPKVILPASVRMQLKQRQRGFGHFVPELPKLQP